MAFGLTAVQRRGTVTVPQSLRAALDWQDGRPVLMRQLDAQTWESRIIPDAETLFRYYAPTPGTLQAIPCPPLTHRVIPPLALWHAYADPASPWRPEWQAISRGLRQRRCDPLALTDWTTSIATWLPDHPRRAQSRFLSAVLAWPGLLVPDRLRWLAALAAWGDEATLPWLDAVWGLETPAGSAAASEPDDSAPTAEG